MARIAAPDPLSRPGTEVLDAEHTEHLPFLLSASPGSRGIIRGTAGGRAVSFEAPAEFYGLVLKPHRTERDPRVIAYGARASADLTLGPVVDPLRYVTAFSALSAENQEHLRREEVLGERTGSRAERRAVRTALAAAYLDAPGLDGAPACPRWQRRILLGPARSSRREARLDRHLQHCLACAESVHELPGLHHALTETVDISVLAEAVPASSARARISGARLTIALGLAGAAIVAAVTTLVALQSHTGATSGPRHSLAGSANSAGTGSPASGTGVGALAPTATGSPQSPRQSAATPSTHTTASPSAAPDLPGVTSSASSPPTGSTVAQSPPPASTSQPAHTAPSSQSGTPPVRSPTPTPTRSSTPTPTPTPSPTPTQSPTQQPTPTPSPSTSSPDCLPGLPICI